MAISYRDKRKTRQERTSSGPWIALVAVAVGLIYLGPEVTETMTRMVSTMLRLPTF
jgi:hypothetical protein